MPLFLSKEDLDVAVQSAYKQRNAAQIQVRARLLTLRDQTSRHLALVPVAGKRAAAPWQGTLRLRALVRRPLRRAGAVSSSCKRVCSAPLRTS